MKKAILLLSSILLFLCAIASAYEPATHNRMTLFAGTQSIFNDPGFLKSIGLKNYSLSDGRQLFKNSEGKDLTITELLTFGSEWEDDRDALQALRHFYDPARDVQLRLPFIGNPVITSDIIKSPDWALEDSNNYGDQEYSLKDAHNFYYQALTSTDENTRKENWGLTFQTIGHVIHHLQDMAQPQHVRNDPHCNAITCFVLGVLAQNIYYPFQVFDYFYDPSDYERFAGKFPPSDDLFNGYQSVFSDSNPQIFSLPRQLWTTTVGMGTEGKGIAEYTNRGFFSKRTLPGMPEYSHYQSPTHQFNQVEALWQLCQEAINEGRDPGCPADVDGTDFIAFYSNEVKDSLQNTTTTNSRALSNSVFDQDLERIGEDPIFALNRFNYYASYEFLLPRAVGYSAGLINYFFRGILIATPPPRQRLYSIISQKPETPTDQYGFNEFKVELFNNTPDITNTPDINAGTADISQDMSNGTLQAVAKFYKDECFPPRDSVTGSYVLPAAGASVCKSSTEYLVKSKVKMVPSETSIPMSGPPALVTFVFDDQNLIPVDAIDLTVQIVYRGQLGLEEDAVVVTSINVTEPTLVNLSNDFDYYWDDNDQVQERASDPNYDPSQHTFDGIHFIFSSGDYPPSPLTGFSVSTPLGPGSHTAVWTLSDWDFPLIYGFGVCDSCGGQLLPLIARRVESNESGGADLLSDPPYNIRGAWQNNGVSYGSGIPDSAGLNCETYAECLTTYFPNYDPIGASAFVNVEYQ